MVWHCSQVAATEALAARAKGDSARRFGVKGIPASVLIGADAKVLAVHQGFKDTDRMQLEALFIGALGTLPR